MTSHDNAKPYARDMGRWQPGASGRLLEAALGLFLERGFEQTTVADIADRAGVTARTFFRHFTDKREVLFSGSPQLEEVVYLAVASAPAAASPLDIVAIALDVVAEMIGEDRTFARSRHAVIMANLELRERELLKLASISAALAEGLRRRGVNDPEASLAAEVGVAVYRVAFDRWINAADGDLSDVIRASLAQLSTLTDTSSTVRSAFPRTTEAPSSSDAIPDSAETH